MTEEDQGLRAFFSRMKDTPWHFLERFAEFSPEFREEASTDWEQATRDAWPPLSVGERFFLVAPWDRDARYSARDACASKSTRGWLVGRAGIRPRSFACRPWNAV